tara:strand:- start:288 stop:950 length:663 start_codon:yes stop_codon:yes gene_type:complete
MAYLGTPPRSRVLSSADIDSGAVTLDDISFTDQSTSVNVSGNIDKHTMRLSDQVVIDGDLNITDNLILSKISDDGNAIILTTDGSTRTIEGAGGSLEASTLTQTPNASLTGMTGTVGSGVTIGSDVALSFGQKQTNVTASRAVNTTYTNSTNKPIFVAVTMTTGTSSDSRWEVGGVTNPGGVYTNSTNGRNNLSTVVPSGDTYKLVVNGGGALSGWLEVR